jgi:hypothetical protein
MEGEGLWAVIMEALIAVAAVSATEGRNKVDDELYSSSRLCFRVSYCVNQAESSSFAGSDRRAISSLSYSGGKDEIGRLLLQYH